MSKDMRELPSWISNLVLQALQLQESSPFGPSETLGGKPLWTAKLLAKHATADQVYGATHLRVTMVSGYTAPDGTTFASEEEVFLDWGSGGFDLRKID